MSLSDGFYFGGAELDYFTQSITAYSTKENWEAKEGGDRSLGNTEVPTSWPGGISSYFWHYKILTCGEKWDFVFTSW